MFVCIWLDYNIISEGLTPLKHIRKEGLSLSTARRRCGGQPVVPYHCQSSTFEFVIYYKLSCVHRAARVPSARSVRRPAHRPAVATALTPALMRFRCTSIKHLTVVFRVWIIFVFGKYKSRTRRLFFLRRKTDTMKTVERTIFAFRYVVARFKRYDLVNSTTATDRVNTTIVVGQTKRLNAIPRVRSSDIIVRVRNRGGKNQWTNTSIP